MASRYCTGATFWAECGCVARSGSVVKGCRKVKRRPVEDGLQGNRPWRRHGGNVGFRWTHVSGIWLLRGNIVGSVVSSYWSRENLWCGRGGEGARRARPEWGPGGLNNLIQRWRVGVGCWRTSSVV